MIQFSTPGGHEQQRWRATALACSGRLHHGMLKVPPYTVSLQGKRDSFGEVRGCSPPERGVPWMRASQKQQPTWSNHRFFNCHHHCSHSHPPLPVTAPPLILMTTTGPTRLG